MNNTQNPAWLIILQLIASPILGGIGAFLSRMYADRERIFAYVEWVDQQDQDGDIVRVCKIAVKNKSSEIIVIDKIVCKSGLFNFFEFPNNIIYYGEMDDFDYLPRAILVGATAHFPIDSHAVELACNNCGKFRIVKSKIIQSPRAIIEIISLNRSKYSLSAELALNNRSVPAWMVKPWWKRVFKMAGPYKRLY